MSSTDELRDAAKTLAQIARDEDLGSRDLTSEIRQESGDATFQLVSREPGVFAGRAMMADVLDVYDPAIQIDWSMDDGDELQNPPVQCARLTGPIITVLQSERVVLNFLQRLCGVATLTRHFVDAVAHTGAQIFDTRKTIPGWRLLDKYAVRCGGGHNHRMGLYDAVLVKDNHLATVPVERLAGVVFEMLNALGSVDPPPSFVEVEADSLDQLRELFKVVGIDVILLDNFPLADLKEAVRLRDELNLTGRIELEASGGITLETVRPVAKTRVDRISVGQITHSAPAIDLSLERMSDS